MNEKGIGKYQIKLEKEAQQKVLEALSDGKWHRYRDLQKRTGLSSATLTKHLKKLKRLKFIEKRLDLKSGKYPYPVYYRLDVVTQAQVTVYSKMESIMSRAHFMLEKEQPRLYLHLLNGILGTISLTSMQTIEKGEEGKEYAEAFFELFVISPFRFYIRKLMSHLEKQAREGKNLEELLTKSTEQYIADFVTLFKEIAKKEPLAKEFQKFLEMKGVEV